MIYRFAAVFACALATPGFAQSVTLSPADPQPTVDDLSPGLAVSYAYPRDVRLLEDAADALGSAKKGPPIKGLSYVDTNEGEMTLTSKKATKVAAAISGFIRFDMAGTFEVELISNDGIAASIGGQQIGLYDGVHACEPAGIQEVVVPEAAWYPIEITYFQRKGSACLEMDWNVGGRMGPVPDAVFAHIE
ncbi:hypothetical protein HKX54_04665 [Sulfitobacter sp. M57]|uniref:PA14 domain-containing protein n=1 Tax=unclassified Sulfitobacter TaxID=196795 RepID=UPI0023E147B8|nr:MULTISPECIES: PA14 domain-containing protein [unclassified Sulfitobacter]MDF3413741.1 hypothetical protein [Sulfitobacter sp. KE5]MDF3420978.1 hypothetical protein [Sulfitobacter sp. KE43]MDF3432287.1 hypothetical protein [Sulfitobacter sp. KE42]MDF3457926.1 hypothetical protein [Sulfitobacter sp. S74]MDF3461827.1 hypothetical protein [Sulfitobacter sp. Ks18]